MSCEQALVIGYKPRETPFETSKTQSLGLCSERCCNDDKCGIYSYQNNTKTCDLFEFPPNQLIYLPLPSTKNMVYTGDQNLNTGILMKRKIMTWVPWLALIIILLMLFCYYIGR